MEIKINSKLTFGKQQGKIINEIFYKCHFNYLLWLHNNTYHKLDDTLLKICKDLREVQFQYELVEHQEKMNKIGKSDYDKYAHTDDPYYIPGEDDW